MSQNLLDAVCGRMLRGEPTLSHFDQPILLLQHMLWHKGFGSFLTSG